MPPRAKRWGIRQRIQQQTELITTARCWRKFAAGSGFSHQDDSAFRRARAQENAELRTMPVPGDAAAWQEAQFRYARDQRLS